MVVLFAAVHLLLIAGIAFLVRRSTGGDGRLFWTALGFRMLTGIGVGLLYAEYYSGGDTLTYHEDAMRVVTLARTDLAGYFSFLLSDAAAEEMALVLTAPRALMFTRMTSVFYLLTNSNYWATGFYLSFFSFLGAWTLVRVIAKNIPAASGAAIVAFLFMPSVVFWSSGVIKESLTTGALCFLAALFLRIWFRQKLYAGYAIFGSLCLWLLWTLKYYYAAVFLVVICTSLLYRLLFARRSFPFVGSVVAWLLLLMLPALLVTYLHPNFNTGRLWSVIVENNNAYRALSSPDNLVHFHNLEATPASMLVNAPWALVSGLFRPFVWEVSSWIQWAAALENAVLLLLLITSVPRMRLVPAARHRLLIVSAVVYVLALAIFLTLSAPNLGTLSRYRVGYISFFCLLILGNHPALHYVESKLAPLVYADFDRGTKR